jgi:plasmid stability protein
VGGQDLPGWAAATPLLGRGGVHREAKRIAPALDDACNMHQNAYMRRDAAITVRVPQGLKRQLAQRARREHRSISAQVLFELERAVANEHPGEPTRAALGLLGGAKVPTDDDFREVRLRLWGRLGHRDG